MFVCPFGDCREGQILRSLLRGYLTSIPADGLEKKRRPLYGEKTYGGLFRFSHNRKTYVKWKISCFRICRQRANPVKFPGLDQAFVKNRQIVSKINTIKVDNPKLILPLSTLEKCGNALNRVIHKVIHIIHILSVENPDLHNEKGNRCFVYM